MKQYWECLQCGAVLSVDVENCPHHELDTIGRIFGVKSKAQYKAFQQGLVDAANQVWHDTKKVLKENA